MYIIYIFCMYIYIYIEQKEREGDRQIDRQMQIHRKKYLCRLILLWKSSESAMFRAIGQTSLKTVLFHKITTLRNYTVFDTVYEIQTQGKIKGKTKFKPNNLDDK